MSFGKIVLACALALLAATAIAAGGWVDVEKRLTAQQMHETGLDTLSPEQLARLNELLRQQVAASEPRAERPSAPGGAERGAESYLGMDAERVVTRVQGKVSGWEPGTEFHLANGQVWKVLKGNMKLPKPLDSPEVLLVPGVLGRWFLQIDEDLPKARVYRTD